MFIVRILKLYIIWTIIYLPCSIFWIKNDNKSFLTYIKECLFDGSYLHLWYLPSLIIAALLATVLCKYIKEKYVVLISIILYLVGLADTCWYYWAENSSMEQVIHAYDNIFITTRNGLFFGFAFFMLGVVAVKINYSMRKTLLLLAVSVIGLIVEMYLLRYLGIAKNYDSVIFSLPTTFVLFLTAKNMKLKDSNKYKWLRSAGVLLWFIHCWVDFTYSILCYNILHRTFNSMIRFGYTMLISMILCVIVLKLQKKEKCKWLRNLY